MTNLFFLVSQIKNDPKFHMYHDICYKFVNYLDETSTLYFKINGQWVNEGNLVEHNLPYIHRWTDIYRRSVLARLYKFEEWFNENPSPVTMLTLTTYQDGDFSIREKGHLVTIPDSFEILKENWKKRSMLIRNRIRKNVDYLWILEPHMKHDTGYPHNHSLFLTKFTPKEQERIRSLWYEKYKAGSYDHGVDFTIVEPEESIKNIRNYLMKYLAKTFVNTGSKFSKSPDWTKGQLVFNAVARENKYRLWGSSRNLTMVMKRAPNVNEEFEIEWFKTELCGSYNELIEVWKANPDRMEIIKNRYEDYIELMQSLKIV